MHIMDFTIPQLFCHSPDFHMVYPGHCQSYVSTNGYR